MNKTNHEMADDMAEHAMLTHQGWTKVCTGPCTQGRTTCPCPESCEVPSEEHEGFGAVVWPLFAFVVSAFLVTVALGLARLFA